MSRSGRTFIRLTAALLVAGSGCSLHGLSFRADKRVTIASPLEQQEVELPLVVRLDEHRMLTAGAGERYAVLVDQPPPRPGEDLRDLLGPDCKGIADCPSEQLLREHAIYLSSTPSVTIDVLPTSDGSQSVSGGRRHNLTVVVIDATGTRVDESAAAVEFREHNP